MADLLEELKEVGDFDSENFIYLNEQGKAELKQELLFKWSEFPSKKIHITCSQLDSISYIKTLLYVLLEKYPIFINLKSLKIVNFSNAKELLPEKGQIGDFIKPETFFTFDLESSDIWLEVQIDFRDLALVIFFEAKVPKDIEISHIKFFITEILNSILNSQNHTETYNHSELSMQKVRFTEDTILSTELKTSIINQKSKVKKYKDLNDDFIVKNTFTYINRYILCVPQTQKILHNSKQKKSLIREIYNPVILEILQNMDFKYQIRNPRTEVKVMTKSHKAVTGKRKVQAEAQKCEVCRCVII